MSGEFTEPNAYQRLPYNYVEGKYNLPLILDAAGLDEAKYGNKDFLLQEGLWGLMELFSDYELRILRGDQITDLGARMMKGPERYGDFYTSLSSLREKALTEGGPIADEINRLARFCGSELAELVANGTVQIPDSKIARPTVTPPLGLLSIQFNSYKWTSKHRPAVVLEYGPGLTGTKFTDAQLLALSKGINSFQYIAISDGPFINQFLLRDLGNKAEGIFGRDVRDRITHSGALYAGREDGMLLATKELLSTPQPGGTTEVCDVILLTGVHEANQAELEFAIKNSPKLLRPDGRLFISAPLSRVTKTTTTFKEQMLWAREAGYDIEWECEANTGNSSVGTNTRSGLAVLRKN